MEVKKRTPEGPKYLSVLAYGWSGSGKTHFGGTAVRAGLKTLFVVPNTEELLTLDGMGLKDYDYIVLTEYSRMWDLYLMLRKNEAGYQAVVLDGLTEIQQSAKDRAVAGGELIPYESFIKGEKRLYLQDWGVVLEMLRHFLVPFMRLPIHKVVTCLAEVDVDPKDGSPRVYPFIQGSMQQLLPAYFSIVGFSSVVSSVSGEVYYCFTTQSHPNLTTKDRIGPPRLYENPDIGRLLQILQGKEVRQTEIEQRLQKSLTISPVGKQTSMDRTK